MNCIRILPVLFLLLAAGAALGGESVTLVRSGRPVATLVLAADATRAARFAAAELQYHLQKITGATLPVVTDAQEVTGTRVLVGESKATRALGLHSADFQPQEYLISLRPNLVILMGHDADDRGPFDYNDAATFPKDFDAQATDYAVYDFLERYCGVRWYLPTDLGICFTSTETLTVTGSDLRRAPVMKTRGQSTGYQFPADLKGDTVKDPANPPKSLPWRDQALWWRRVRLGGEAYSANHSLYGYYKRFLETHPEYFAQGGTGQPTQMCYTNPGLIAQVIQDARDYYDGKPPYPGGAAAGDYFAVVPMDNSAWCKCAECAKKTPTVAVRGKGEFSNDSASNYLFGFINQVAKAVGPDYPGKYIAALAYSSYAYPPTDEKLAPNVSIQMCLHARMVYNPQVQANDEAIIRAWEQESPTRRKFLWLYYCFPSLSATQQQFRCFPGFFAHSVVKEMARYHRAGIRGLYYEPSYLQGSQRSALMDQLEAFLTWKLADDPTLDGDQLIDEFFVKYYGHAAKPMQRMYERIEQIYCDPANYPTYRGHQNEASAWGDLGTAARMAELGKIMEEAKLAAETDVEWQRVALFEQGIWEYMQKGRATYEQHLAQKAAAQQRIQVPRIVGASPAGDPTKVDWTGAAVMKNWRTLMGDLTPREVEGRLLHDGTYLYLQLEEKLDPRKLVLTDDNVWGEDEWEIFIAKQQARPYSHMGVNAKGTHVDLTNTGEMSDWDSGAVVVSDRSQPDRWTVRIAFPLDKLVPGGAKAPGQLWMNVIRATRMQDALSWIPTFDGFHAPECFGEVMLKQ